MPHIDNPSFPGQAFVGPFLQTFVINKRSSKIVLTEPVLTPTAVSAISCTLTFQENKFSSQTASDRCSSTKLLLPRRNLAAPRLTVWHIMMAHLRREQ